MNNTVKVCCECKRVNFGGVWEKDTNILNKDNVSHGYCPQCLQKALEENSRYSYSSVPVPAFA